MLDENGSIKTLNLSNCRINASNLTLIAGALTKPNNQLLITLDIRDNPIEDPQYKVLFGLLQNNKSLIHLNYTLYDEHNIHHLEGYRKMYADGMTEAQI